MKTTIQMAREAAGDDWGLFQEYMPEIHRLAELVRADEREAIIQEIPGGFSVDPQWVCDMIRARGNK